MQPYHAAVELDLKEARDYVKHATDEAKLWAKQAAGKKRMKQVGQVEIPQEAFLAVLESDQ